MKETRQQKEKESRIPDTKGYTEAADKVNKHMTYITYALFNGMYSKWIYEIW